MLLYKEELKKGEAIGSMLYNLLKTEPIEKLENTV